MIYQILALIIWSSSFIAAKYAYVMLEPAMVVLLRLVIAAFVVLPVARRHLGRVPRSYWKPLLWLTFLNYVVVLMLQFLGVAHTSVASAVTIVGLEPVMMVFVGHFFFGDKADWYHWLLGAAAFAGVVLLIAGGAESGGEVDLLGCALVFAAGLIFCCTMRPTKRLVADVGAPVYTSLSLVLGAIMCLPFALLVSENYAIQWNIAGVASMIYLGVGCSWFAYWLWNKGMGTVSANVSGVLIALEPVCGVLLAVLLLGEQLSTLSWAGIAIVITAALASSWIPTYRANRKTAA